MVSVELCNLREYLRRFPLALLPTVWIKPIWKAPTAESCPSDQMVGLTEQTIADKETNQGSSLLLILSAMAIFMHAAAQLAETFGL